MRYEGKVYRPWIEAESILLQVTIGCSNNRCTFCNMFREKKFSKRDLKDVFQDIQDLKNFYPQAESIFLTDGNVMVLPTEYLLKVLNKITEVFPNIKNIALYSELNDLRRKSVEDLIKLREAGVKKVYSGLESGDSIVLEKIKKRMTSEQVVEGMAKAKEADIDVLLSFIFGLGGKYRSQEHIEETVKLLNITKPEEIAPMALAVQPNTDLEDEINRGEFIQCTPRQILEEERYLLDNLEGFNTYYWGDHGNNLVPMKGRLPVKRDLFLKKIEGAIKSHPKINEEIHRTFSW